MMAKYSKAKFRLYYVTRYQDNQMGGDHLTS